MRNPCLVHPDTGDECPLLHRMKSNPRCAACQHRVRYVRALDGHYDEPESAPQPGPPAPPQTKERPLPDFPSKRTATIKAKRRYRRWDGEHFCWWIGCDGKAHTRGLCRTHYKTLSDGRLYVPFRDVEIDDREDLFRTVMQIAGKHAIEPGEALIVLLDEGVLQYRKRMR